MRALNSPAQRAVTEDAARGQDTWSAAALLYRWGLLSADAAAYAAANADANADADADADADANAYDADADADADAYATNAYTTNAYADAYAYADANAYANAAADANAYADADADAYAHAANSTNSYSGGKHMRQGLYIWAQPSGTRVVLRIGWVRRIAEDEYEALHMVTPKRNGDYTTMFADLAHDGPPKIWTFTRPLPRASPLNRFHVLGPVSLDPAQWQQVCPQPKEWVES